MKKLLLIAALLVAACGDDDDHGHTTPPECEPIAEACHPSTTTEGQECHENAEGVWTAAECTEHSADCLAKCMPDGGM